MNLVYYQ